MNHRHRLAASLGLLFAVAMFVSCDNDPAKGKPVAKVENAVEVATANVGAATAATKYVFSNAGSKIEFVGAKVTRKHDGAFNVFSGAIEMVQNDLTRSTLNMEIATASLTADDPKLTSHLKSADLLDVEKYPKATFSATTIRAGGANGATHTVTGNLQLHGVTKSITFPVQAIIGPDALQAVAEFAINRKDFGIVYPGMPDDLIKDEVLLKLNIHAMKMPR
jgi:polyisoprenoid-binding protein YceI